MVSARAALLIVLREGPGYGRGLVRRIAGATAGRERLAEGTIYPALRGLEAEHLVRSFEVVPGRRRGERARTYYELTERGLRASEADRTSLLRLAAGAVARAPGPEERDRMRRRLELGAELSEAALDLAQRGGGRRRRRSA
jgi:DNA-binding PadR family transcriptional regulator